MALLSTIADLSFGDVLQLADGLFQNTVRIRPSNRNLIQNLAALGRQVNPFREEDQIVFLSVTEVEELTYRTAITEKPVADLGGAFDYISRESTPLNLTTIFSNRSFDIRSDPVEFLTGLAGSFAPEVANVIDQQASFASNFFDLGADEIDKKIRTLRFWQLNAIPVEVLGAKLDASNHLTAGDSFNYLIEEISLVYDESFGDNVGANITLKNLLNIQGQQSQRQGGRLGEVINTVLTLANPF